MIEMESVCVLIYKEFRNTVKRKIFLSSDLTVVIFKVFIDPKGEGSWLKPDLNSNEGLEVRSYVSKVP